MNRALLVFLFASVCAVSTLAQQTIPPDVRLWAILPQDIAARKLRVGAQLKLRVPIPLRSRNGDIILPDETTLIGTVTQACSRKECNGVSSLSFVVTEAKWKGGSMPLRAVPASVHAPGGVPRNNTRIPMPSAEASRAKAAEIADRLQGISVRDTGDPQTVTVITSDQRDVVLPTSTVIEFRIVPTT